MFRIFAFSAIAIVVVLFVPEQAKRTSKVIVDQILVSGGIGLLSLVIAGPIMALLAVTIFLLPVSLLLGLILIFALFFGWIAIGQEIGRRIGAALGQDWSEPIQAGVGTLLLTFTISAFNFVFWDVLGWMIGILAAAIGLGAVLLTRFGTRDYTSSRTPVSPLTPASPEALTPPAPLKPAPQPKTKSSRQSKTKIAAKPKASAKKRVTRKTSSKKKEHKEEEV
jgi:hypothetical protein